MRGHHFIQELARLPPTCTYQKRDVGFGVLPLPLIIRKVGVWALVPTPTPMIQKGGGGGSAHRRESRVYRGGALLAVSSIVHVHRIAVVALRPVVVVEGDLCMRTHLMR